jgi:putative endonuclease
MTLQKKKLGAKGEDIAVRFLRNKGYRILERNYRVKLGEIDIIAEQGADLVFIEVKTRSDRFFGSPLEALTEAKQRQLARVALEYLSKKEWLDRPVRFDVVGIHLPRINAPQSPETSIDLVRNAFDLC